MRGQGCVESVAFCFVCFRSSLLEEQCFSTRWGTIGGEAGRAWTGAFTGKHERGPDPTRPARATAAAPTQKNDTTIRLEKRRADQNGKRGSKGTRVLPGGGSTYGAGDSKQSEHAAGRGIGGKKLKEQRPRRRRWVGAPPCTNEGGTHPNTPLRPKTRKMSTIQGLGRREGTRA